MSDRNFQTQGYVDVRLFATVALSMIASGEPINKSSVTNRAFELASAGREVPKTAAQALEILKMLGIGKFTIGSRGKQALINTLMGEEGGDT